MPLSRRTFLACCAAAAATAALPDNCFGLPWSISEQQLADDILRPQYHLLPAKNWMNDPNGPIYWNGQYHVCFQYNPNGAFWGDMHWAHSMSPDMIHWKHLPIALAPTKGGPDQEGCFSGSAVVDHGVPTFIYTGVAASTPEQATLRDGQHNFRETQCLATSNDPQLLTWQKLPKPVLDSPPAGMQVTGFRDPALWKDGDTWYMVIGSGVPKQGGLVLLYRSPDLRSWEYIHPLHSGKWNGKVTPDTVDSGEMWECPDFFQLGNKHVLLYSSERKVYWTVGDYDKKELTYRPQKQGLLDSGSYYAPKSMVDRDGNRILWGWIPETRPVEEYKPAGWAGLMALPRVLTVNDAGELEMRVVPAIAELRGQPVESRSGRSFANFSAELQARFQAQKPFALQFGPAAKPYLDLSYDPVQKVLRANGQSVALTESNRSGSPELNIFMDGSTIEIFVGNRQAHTVRVYTLDAKSANTPVRFSGDLSDVQLWPIKPISNNRLTTAG